MEGIGASPLANLLILEACDEVTPAAAHHPILCRGRSPRQNFVSRCPRQHGSTPLRLTAVTDLVLVIEQMIQLVVIDVHHRLDQDLAAAYIDCRKMGLDEFGGLVRRRTIMANDNASLGKTSLWTSIVGVVLPVSLAILVAIFLKPSSEKALANALCGVLFVILELIALGCGIAGRRTATGKAGLVISVILLLLFSFSILFFMPISTTQPALPTDAPTSTPQARP